MLHEALKKNRWQIVLKARQTGTSTFVAAYYLHKALFNRNHRVAIAAHTLEAVRQIFNIYQTIYDNLPPQLRLECTNENANELRFKHGSRIKVGTPNGFRGSTYQSIHASEAAFWKSPDEDIAALLQTAGENPTIVFESTPNGLNHYHDLWTTESGYDKVFISWLIEPSYNQKEEVSAPPPSDSEADFLKSLPTPDKTTEELGDTIPSERSAPTLQPRSDKSMLVTPYLASSAAASAFSTWPIPAPKWPQDSSNTKIPTPCSHISWASMLLKVDHRAITQPSLS